MKKILNMLADTLERHSASLSEDSVAEYLKAGLALDSTNLRLRLLHQFGSGGTQIVHVFRRQIETGRNIQ